MFFANWYMEGKIICLEIIKMIRNQLFRQTVIMEVNQHVYVQTVEKKSHLVNLDLEIWEMEILEINHGVKVVGKLYGRKDSYSEKGI